ncbi:MAG: hypothetical protein WBQ10_03660 [Terriglobales bacterium]
MNNEMTGYVFAFLFCAGLGLISFVLWQFFSALRSPDADAWKEAKRKARLAVIYLIIAIALTPLRRKPTQKSICASGDSQPGMVE